MFRGWEAEETKQKNGRQGFVDALKAKTNQFS